MVLHRVLLGESTVASTIKRLGSPMWMLGLGDSVSDTKKSDVRVVCRQLLTPEGRILFTVGSPMWRLGLVTNR